MDSSSIIPGNPDEDNEDGEVLGAGFEEEQAKKKAYIESIQKLANQHPDEVYGYIRRLVRGDRPEGDE